MNTSTGKNITSRTILSLGCLCFVFFLFGQAEVDSNLTYSIEQPEDTSIVRIQEYEAFNLPQNYHAQYRAALRRARRVYPLALYAAQVIDSLDQQMASLDKKRHQKKLARQTHNALKDDFKYLLKELYISEGVVLSKLIYRETGMTVKEIIETYKSGAQAKLYSGLAGMFDQDLASTYDPNGEDFVLECVIRDMLSGKVAFDPTFEIVDKQHYKEDRKAYKQRVKKRKKELRKKKREN